MTIPPTKKTIEFRLHPGTRGEAAVPYGIGPDQRGRAAQAAAAVHCEGRRRRRQGLAGAEEALQDVHGGTTWWKNL